MIINRVLKIGDRLMERNGKLVTLDLDIGTVQPRHLRLRMTPGTGPTRYEIAQHTSGTWTQICTDPNIWDLYVLDGGEWANALSLASAETRVNIVEVIDGDASGVTYMDGCFANCLNIRSVGPLYNTDSVVSCWHTFYGMGYGGGSIVHVTPFDTSNVRDFRSMFEYQQKLREVPLLDTSSARDLTSMYSNCVNVETGILAAYNEMTSHGFDPYRYHWMTFGRCGINTPTGRAELAQIPSSWK